MNWIMEDWPAVTKRLNEIEYQGFWDEMWAWMLTMTHRRHRQLLVHNLYLADAIDTHDTYPEPPVDQHSSEDWGGEAWGRVDALAKEEDACSLPLTKALKHFNDTKLPHFLHFSQHHINSEDKQHEMLGYFNDTKLPHFLHFSQHHINSE